MAFDLKDLTALIAHRADARDGSSYTASLVAAGMERAAKKLGEEAVESVIAAMSGEKPALIGESADLIYHLCVVWHMAGIACDDVMAELERRTRMSGLQEKASRSAHD